MLAEGSAPRTPAPCSVLCCQQPAGPQGSGSGPTTLVPLAHPKSSPWGAGPGGSEIPAEQPQLLPRDPESPLQPKPKGSRGRSPCRLPKAPRQAARRPGLSQAGKNQVIHQQESVGRP